MAGASSGTITRPSVITGFAVVSGDRHSFWAGYAAKALPPKSFDPVGVAFITGSISAPGMAEAVEHGLKEHPLRPLFVSERQPGKFESTINLTLKHGSGAVRFWTCDLTEKYIEINASYRS